MRVKLITHTPNPEKIIALGARRCYSGKELEQLSEEMTEEKVAALVKNLFDKRHLSPFEHATFTFEISGVSRALSHQLVRHRIASYCQSSQRYINEADFEYVVPLKISQDVKAAKEYFEIIQAIKNGYKKLVEMGVAKEDARYLLPNATATKLVMTMNARALIEFLRSRLCERAQTEVRTMAKLMLQQLQLVAPNVFNKVDSPCIMDGQCREGIKHEGSRSR